MLSAADFAASLRFYGGLLGGVEAYRFPEDEPVFVTLRFGDSEVGIGTLSGEPLHGQPQRPASGHRIELCLYVDDVDATVKAADAQRVPIVLEPRDMPWGERIAYVSDPDGNLVMLCAPSSQGSAKETSSR
jgi:lactoylglutathione lyase